MSDFDTVSERLSATDGDEEDNSWEQEDPNLLNNPTLLYQEAESLPLPSEESIAQEEEFQKAVTIMRQLIFENNIILQDGAGKSEELGGSKEAAFEVVDNMINAFTITNQRITDAISRNKKLPVWDDESYEKVFGDKCLEKIQRWKASLNVFLESYSKIRNFIPKEVPEDKSGPTLADTTREQLKHLPDVFEELEKLLGVLETLKD